MSDFILNRKISVDTYQFPEGAFKIYGGGKFYNGFSIGDATKLSVVNKDGVLKFSREATKGQETTSVIFGTIPKNNKVSIYIDIASPLSTAMVYGFLIDSSNLVNDDSWTLGGIRHTTGSESTQKLQAGGVLSIYFQSPFSLQAIPNLLAVRPLWAL